MHIKNNYKTSMIWKNNRFILHYGGFLLCIILRSRLLFQRDKAYLKDSRLFYLHKCIILVAVEGSVC